MSSARRNLMILAAVAILAAGALLVRAHRAPARASAGAVAQFAATGPRVETAMARIGSVARFVRGEGRIAAAPDGISQLSFAVAGRIAAVEVHVGQHVRAGDAVARLDLSTVSAAAEGDLAALATQAQAARERLAVATVELERAQRLARSTSGAELSSEAAQVRQDQARIAGDQAALRRARTLYRGGVDALKDVEAARQQLALDRAALAADRAKLPDALLQAKQRYAQAVSDAAAASAALSAARRGASNATLRAPIDGVVTALDKNPGEWADPGAVVATVVNPATAELRVALPEDEAALVQTGDPAQAGSARGRVVRVVHPLDPTTQMGQAIVTFSSDPPRALGAVLPVEIRTGVHRGVTLVPQTAVVQDPASGAYTVFARSGRTGRFAPVAVRVGWAHGGWQEVRAAAIRPGTSVATYGSYELLAAGS